jgi:hypothetical protein
MAADSPNQDGALVLHEELQPADQTTDPVRPALLAPLQLFPGGPPPELGNTLQQPGQGKQP